MATAFDFSKDHATFSGCDMAISLLFPDSKPVYLGECSTLSYSTFRDRAPVRTLGRIGPKGFTKGNRTVAGTLVFTVFDKHAINRVREQVEYLHGIGVILPDELPSFDLLVTMANEYGASARLRIYGVAVHEEGMTLTTEDLFTENVWSYQARAIRPLDEVGPFEGDDLESTFIFDNAEVPGRFVLSDLIGSRESIDLRLAIEKYRKEQEQFLGDALQIGVDYSPLENSQMTHEVQMRHLANWATAEKSLYFAVQLKLPDGTNATGEDLPPHANGSTRVVLRSGSGIMDLRWTEEPGAFGYWITVKGTWIPYMTTFIDVEGMEGKFAPTYVEIVRDDEEVDRVADRNGTGIYISQPVTLKAEPSKPLYWQIWNEKPSAKRGLLIQGVSQVDENIIEEDFQVVVVDTKTNAAKPGEFVKVHVGRLVRNAAGTLSILDTKQILNGKTNSSGRFKFKVPVRHVWPWIDSGVVVIAEYWEDTWGWTNEKRDEVSWYFNEPK